MMVLTLMREKKVVFWCVFYQTDDASVAAAESKTQQIGKRSIKTEMS